MTKKDFVARGSAWIQRAPEDGKDAVSYEIQLDTDSVLLKNDTKKFETHKLGNVRFIQYEGKKMIDKTNEIINTYSYIILYYGYEGGVYKAISYSANDGVTDIWNTIQMNVGDDADCYGAKYIWYDKNLPDNDDAMFKKIWSELDGVPPTELGIKILATKMFTVRREADSVQSSDVMFGISDSNTQAPTTWITNFSDLTLADGKYVWTCTKTTLTNGTSYYTGAYCLGDCYDFAQVEELYALSDSSTNSPAMENYSSSYKAVKGKYLWSCVRVTYSDNSINYLNIRCVSYFPTDGTNGTKFTPKGTAYGHYEASSKMPKPSDDVLGLLYLVDKADTLFTPINKPCVVWWRSFSESSYMLSYDEAEEGDAYNVGGTLWVHNGTVWKDFGSIQGPKGDDGEDALNIELSTDKILFSWDSKKQNYNAATKEVTLVVKQGGNIINKDDYNVSFQAVENFELGSNGKNIRTEGASNGYNISIYSAGISKKEYTFNASVNGKEQKVSYPASSCSVKVLITYNGITYTKIISIEVSFVQLYGDTAWNTEQLSSTYGELVSTGGRLSTMETNISQNAKNITMTATRTDGLEKQYSEIKVQYDNISLKVSNTEKGLRDTGIDITNGSITMTANKFKLYNKNKGEVFSTDADGNGVFKGTITATGGSFGSLQMTSYTDGTGFEFYGMHAHTDGTTMIAASTYTLDYQGLYVGSGLQDNGGSVRIGNNGRKTDGVFSWDNGVINVDADNSGVSNADISGIGVNVVGNSSHSAIGMKVSATGGKNNYAVYAKEGDFRAENGDFIAEKGAFIGVHRGNVTKISSDYTLKKTDSTIICINKNKGITINLPKPSEVYPGTFYRIIKRGNTVTFNSQKMNIFFVSRGDLMSSVSSELASEWINCFWDGEYWYVEMSGN